MNAGPGSHASYINVYLVAIRTKTGMACQWVTHRGEDGGGVCWRSAGLCVCVCEAVEGSRCRPQACGSCDWGEGGRLQLCGMDTDSRRLTLCCLFSECREEFVFVRMRTQGCLILLYSFFFSLYLTLSVFTLEKQGLCTCELYYWKWKWIKMICGLILHLQCLNGLLTDGCSCHTSLLLNTKLMKHLIKMSFNVFFSIYSLTSHKTVWTLLPLRKTWKRPFILEQLYWKHGVLQNKTHLAHVL